MSIRPLSRFDSPGRIAEGAEYVVDYDDGEQELLNIGFHRIKQRLIRADRELLVTPVSHGDGFRDIISKGAGGIGMAVHLMERYVEAVVRTRKPAFEFHLREDGKLLRVVEHEPGRYYNRLAQLIWVVFNSDFELDRFVVSPRAEVFRSVMKDLEPQAGHMTDCFRRFPVSWDRMASRFCGEFANELSFLILRESDRCRLGQLLTKWEAGGKRARTRMQRFVRTCVAGRESVLALPLDTDYRHEVACSITVERTKRDHAKFVNRLRGNTRLAAVAIGGIWSLDWAPAKGHYFRWLFLLDSSLTGEPAEWTELITDAWRRAVPENAGHVHVPGVNDRAKPATGLIRVDDASQMQMLTDEVDYIVEKDQHLRAQSIAGQRSWGTWVPAGTREDRRRKIASEPASDTGIGMSGYASQ
ncbi:Uncharacterised protein [Burkholderia pseudomallei]|uniref:hypothetical protein n=1 Tax=Burkholderia pseudomallei TaxID=28450 RepID=UPI00097895F5|nr:hypothetical protein [Burkholderia pseudomallei]AYX34651.1 hypothetical protein EGY15_05340 [Burkholderia pseudomallei]OMT50694.1 hypothetical protein AQ759_03290 [Burkholderia pseudomallei]OMT58008.1 hypothetical protein AQ761_05425 [Burkholderia pseudomallei]ONE03089.1 hypothetical protein AQ943_01190 [Burkholderia pseudomallei]ONE09629.1 hypothetical protein AQ944_24680 [Burkholderia pseudomallei]